MNYSNKIDIIDFFEELKEHQYIIVKIWPNFPNYYSYSDVDIFCHNINEVAICILETGNKYIDIGFEIKVNEINTVAKQIDFIIDGKIDFRFDLHGKFPDYKNVNVNQFYFNSMIDNKTSKAIYVHEKEYTVFIPCIIDEMIIRYFDYLEYFEKRNDKIKHLDYIRNKIENSVSLEDFLDRFYLYVSFPKNRISFSYLYKKKIQLIELFQKIRKKGLIGSLKRILFG